MTGNKKKMRRILFGVGLTLLTQAGSAGLAGAALPGGTLDPLTIPKYVIPLVIPPEMPKSTVQPGVPAADYNIAVRQFQQQILPGGIWDPAGLYNLPATTVWGYGRAEDGPPDSSALGGAAGVAPAPNSSFNYPAFTVEATSMLPARVRWINDLVDANGNFLPHLFAVDQTLHWANPPMECMDGTMHTDCSGMSALPYTGPVPIVTHVHGAHVNSRSDGYPEAWWLPDAVNIPAGYATQGTLYDQYDRTNTVPGSAYYAYENNQPAATIWYHDHTMGLTRLNVYAGPAGFWLIRGGVNGDANVLDASTGVAAQLPGPAPVNGAGDPNFDAAYRSTIREIPLAIQDRSFNMDGSLFYPNHRSFFEGLTPPDLQIPFIPDPASDIAPIWNPEAFFNTMVVNGAVWPELTVAPAKYRFRLLNGCSSRFLNLALVNQTTGLEMPFNQLGGDQGFLAEVVRIQTGSQTVYRGNQWVAAANAPHPDQALLMGPAERADVIVDFSSLPDGTRIRLVNTGPDAPFGGFPLDPAAVADPATTGQVMEFVVNSALSQPADATATAPENLLLPAEGAQAAAAKVRQLSLNEAESALVCVTVDAITGAVTAVPGDMPPCVTAGAVPFGPKAAFLGTVMAGMTMPMMWMEKVSETPLMGDTETWEIFNLTMDAHPIHLHLVRFEVIDRQPLVMMPDPAEPMAMMPMPVADPAMAAVPALATEAGYKDTVIAYPGEVTRIKATFDQAGLYVWHCHIIEHEDNEMMRPYVVRHTPDINNNGCVDRSDLNALMTVLRDRKMENIIKLAYDLNNDGLVNIVDSRYLVANFTQRFGRLCR
ncbi:MAG: multicopper oxidase domain-containing protein [Desulfobulbaceae bacterium]|nr:multicopper oxidase domain-containing protein [Desulfobulbaceae bacterium]